MICIKINFTFSLKIHLLYILLFFLKMDSAHFSPVYKLYLSPDKVKGSHPPTASPTK